MSFYFRPKFELARSVRQENLAFTSAPLLAGGAVRDSCTMYRALAMLPSWPSCTWAAHITGVPYGST